jgi:hypothetical protein
MGLKKIDWFIEDDSGHIFEIRPTKKSAFKLANKLMYKHNTEIFVFNSKDLKMARKKDFGVVRCYSFFDIKIKIINKLKNI